VLLSQRAQLGEHRFAVKARTFDQFGRVETVGAIGVRRLTDIVDLDLRAVFFVLCVAASNLVELTGLPIAFAGLEPVSRKRQV
jgi:hypothetical protein